ncbi:MAG: dihydropteroate synthase [Planctomycetota bacterium]
MQASSTWQLRSRTLDFSGGAAVMGILNVTPDSFSDGGKFYTPSQAVDQALRMEDAGADILDVGGESTRPYSEPVSADDEVARIEPVLSALQGRCSIPVSIDTSKSQVAKVAIELGAEILNDVTGLEGDEAMPELAAKTGVGVCAMHMQGTPQTMQDAPTYDNAVADILDYLRRRDVALLAVGIAPARICLDPGIGFGKTHDHNIALLRNAATFHQLGRPILVGHSRKGFIGKLIGDKSSNRMAGSLAISVVLAQAGIQVIRVHDVAETRQALTCMQACSE